MAGYVNVDAHERSAADVVADAIRLPFRASSAEVVESYHLIEHLSYSDVELALQEWHRVLRQHGQLIVECPDLIANMRIMLRGRHNKRWGPYRGEYPGGRVWTIFGSQENDGQFHRSGFDARHIAAVLRRNGFGEITVGSVSGTPERGENIRAEAVRLADRPSGFSIVLPTHSAAAELALCLDSLAVDSELDHELIIIVDPVRGQGPDRNVTRLLNSRALPFAVNEQNLGPYESWNRGARMATRTVVAFVTDDQVFAPGWDSAILRQLAPDRILASQIVEPGVMRPWAGNLTAHCGTTAYTFARERFLRVVEQHRRDGVRAGGFFIPLVMYKDAFDTVGDFRTEGVFGSVHVPNDIEFIQRASAAGFRHLTVRDSFSWHFQASSWLPRPALISRFRRRTRSYLGRVARVVHAVPGFHIR